jgi:hypothetical protein
LVAVSLALAFVPEVVKTVEVEELTIEEHNLIYLFRLIPQALVSISNNNNWIHFLAKVMQ